jgi:hypothetical protein
MGLGMRLVTAAGPFYTELDQDGLCTEVGKYRDWPGKKSSEEVPKDVSPDKRCRGVDFVGSFSSSKRIQRAFAPQAQDCNQRNENFEISDKCFANVNAAEDKGEIFALDVSLKFKISEPQLVTDQRLDETDHHRVNQRQKQIDYGKNTFGYERYIELVSRDQRKKDDPQTPDVKQVCSKRRWDGKVRKWRRLLHQFDPPVDENEERPKFFPVGGRDKQNASINLKSKVATPESKNRPNRTKEFLKIYQDWVAKEP